MGSEVDHPYGFVPHMTNPSFQSPEVQGSGKVAGGYAALHGVPAVDWAGVGEGFPSVTTPRRRGRPSGSHGKKNS
jgi:hypothetical protein